MRPRTRLSSFGPVFVALALLTQSPASSAADPTPSSAEREQARRLVHGAREKRSNGALQDALDDFNRAHAIMGVPTTGIEVGRTQVALGLLVEGRATLMAVARSAAKAGEPPAFSRARTEARELADAVTPRLGALSIIVRGADASSPTDVEIDGVRASPGDLDKITVNPGMHDVVVSNAGSTRKSRVRVAEGGLEEVVVAFSAKPAQTVTLVPKNGGPNGDGTPSTRDDKAPPPSRLNGFTYAGGGIFLAGAATGAVTGILSLRLHDSVESQCSNATGCPPSTDDDVRTGRTLGTVSTISFIVAGAGALVLVYGLFFRSGAKDARAERLPWHLTF